MKFVIEPRKRGRMRRPQWQFRIVADNGETLATSEGYNNRTDAEDAVRLIWNDAGSAKIVQVPRHGQ